MCAEKYYGTASQDAYAFTVGEAQIVPVINKEISGPAWLR